MENVLSLDAFVAEGVFRNSIIRTSGTGAKRREDSIEYNPIDLGLPSGTLWCDRNVGAISPEDFGGYFQWGGTKDMTNGSCIWKEHPYTDDIDRSEKYNFKDKKTVLDLDDDAANVNMGGEWHMPDDSQFRELAENTDSEQVSVKGVKGVLFKSRKNENSIFIPYAGYMEGRKSWYVGISFELWCSTLDHNAEYDEANEFGYDHLDKWYIQTSKLCYGFSVRGVINKK